MKIKNISFGDIPFRMFRNVSIDISERLTVIAGHNGIGKSTLLGLIANGSELKAKEGKTLLKRSFQAQLHELFYLDMEKDYVKRTKDKPFFTLTYSQDGKEDLVKTCNVSKHSEKNIQKNV
jgi:ABC-type cobalamin/Fe3+-siderophores transport systems, ATPase components